MKGWKSEKDFIISQASWNLYFKARKGSQIYRRNVVNLFRNWLYVHKNNISKETEQQLKEFIADLNS